MKCPYCGSENLKTLETRDSPDNTVRRRKECGDCGKRFTSYEYVETVELMVRKKDDRTERLDLNKIVRGLQKACEKLPVSMENIWVDSAQHEVGDLMMKYLRKLDRVACVRFASVYKSFEEPQDFARVLKEVRA
jgi:transcriptional repressor NrdR